MAKFCPNCGSQMEDNQMTCSSCGVDVSTYASSNTNQQMNMNNQQNNNQYVQQNQMNGEQKSKMAAGLLGLFFGSLGVHNFYLGYTGKAIGQLCLTLVGWILCGLGPIIAAIWGVIEGIMILCGSINTDANGIPLKD